MQVEAIARRAAEYNIARVLLTVAATPLYVAGFAVAFIWMSLAWLFAAAQVGWADARSRFEAD